MPSVVALNDTENEIAADMRSGRKAAFAKLYDKYAPALYGCILKIVVDRQSAEDLLQQAFAEIWIKRNSYDGRQSLFAWLLNITKKVISSIVDSKQKTEEEENQKALPIVGIKSIVAQKSITHESGTTGKAEYSALSEVVFELVWFNNFSLKEVSEDRKINEEELRKILRSELNKYKTIR